MRVHLVDGTYELFRHFYGVPSHVTANGEEVAAARGVVASMLGMLEDGATHIGVATDHVIESFRNDMWAGYKTGEGIDPTLWAQFPILEDALRAFGIVVWPMVDEEADDALGSAAAIAQADDRVTQALICTPDKDLGQCVGGKVFQFDRRKQLLVDAAGVRERLGVDPESVPDYLALVGDSADGFPGLAGWGAKSAAAVLTQYRHLEAIPPAPGQWEVTVRSAKRLAQTLVEEMENALLFRELATLRLTCGVGKVDDWHWQGPTNECEAMANRLDAPDLLRKVKRLAAGPP